MAENLSMKKAVQACVELMNIQAERDHDSIEAAVNSLDTLTTITYGEVTAGFGTSVMTAYAAAEGTMDVSGYSANTRLNIKEATQLSLDISKFQANQDHDSLSALIDAAGENAALTDNELLALFSSDVQKAYKNNHTDKYNFYTEPTSLVTILQADDTYGATFAGYTAALSGDVITLSKDAETDITFTITTSGENASIEAASTNYTVNYKTEEVTYTV